jgi:hypothetical protein
MHFTFTRLGIVYAPLGFKEESCCFEERRAANGFGKLNAVAEATTSVRTDAMHKDFMVIER